MALRRSSENGLARSVEPMEQIAKMEGGTTRGLSPRNLLAHDNNTTTISRAPVPASVFSAWLGAIYGRDEAELRNEGGSDTRRTPGATGRRRVLRCLSCQKNTRLMRGAQAQHWRAILPLEGNPRAARAPGPGGEVPAGAAITVTRLFDSDFQGRR